MPRGTCPECDADVQVDEDTDKGDVVECSDCGTQLEVVGLDPIELDVAVEEEEEDWTGRDAIRCYGLPVLIQKPPPWWLLSLALTVSET
jgi:alpha-aminoadipate carrier protein LysW